MQIHLYKSQTSLTHLSLFLWNDKTYEIERSLGGSFYAVDIQQEIIW